MSNTPVTNSPTPARVPARPVSLITIAFVFVLFAAFLLTARYFYRPSVGELPQNASAENYSKDLEWRATAESRRRAFAEQHQQQQAQMSTYAWVDQSAGVVQLPIQRAMELTAQKYGAKK